jgi:HlyD family secretion protein
VEVTATGIVNPHTLVQVGTQVSGTIDKIYVDFNSRVKKGQLVARLDTTFLHAAVEDAEASLRKCQAQEFLSRSTSERTKALFDKGLVAQADLDQTVADYASAKANTSSAQAQLNRAKINLAYAYITSPITGMVVNRNVDVGQTVAASFNTPTLFTIADDLTKMQVQASIDEADVGQVKLGQKTQFTVDAYPDRRFEGTVTQIRLQPVTNQNVVSYTVMIDVNNPDLALMPGMTANITIAVQHASNVIKVPLAALKFSPPQANNGKGSQTWSGGRGNGSGGTQRADSAAMRGGAQTRGEGQSHAGGKQGSFAEGKRDSSTARAGKTGAERSPRIYVLENGKPVRVPVTTGLSNTGFAEVQGDVHEGQNVIVGIVNNDTKPGAPAQSPLSGMPRRF